MFNLVKHDLQDKKTYPSPVVFKGKCFGLNYRRILILMFRMNKVSGSEHKKIQPLPLNAKWSVLDCNVIFYYHKIKKIK